MTDNLELVRRFRSEVPQPDAAAWAGARSALARAIEAERASSHPARRVARWRSPRFLAWGLAALTLTAAGAYGATRLIGIGSPAPPGNPITQLFKVARGATPLLSLRAADPGGAPPWGMRLTFAHRLFPGGLTVCPEFGRIVDGQLGFIGRDGAFHDDRLFHAGRATAEFAPSCGATSAIRSNARSVNPNLLVGAGGFVEAVASAYLGCGTHVIPLSRAQRAAYVHLKQFDARELDALRGPAGRASARAEGVTLAALRAAAAFRLQVAENVLAGRPVRTGFDTCPHRDLRTLYWGFAGASANRVTLIADSARTNETVTASDSGAYLFVIAGAPTIRGDRFKVIANCRDGRSSYGTTSAPPRCGTAK